MIHSCCQPLFFPSQLRPICYSNFSIHLSCYPMKGRYIRCFERYSLKPLSLLTMEYMPLPSMGGQWTIHHGAQWLSYGQRFSSQPPYFCPSSLLSHTMKTHMAFNISPPSWRNYWAVVTNLLSRVSNYLLSATYLYIWWLYLYSELAVTRVFVFVGIEYYHLYDLTYRILPINKHVTSKERINLEIQTFSWYSPSRTK